MNAARPDVVAALLNLAVAVWAAIGVLLAARGLLEFVEWRHKRRLRKFTGRGGR